MKYASRETLDAVRQAVQKAKEQSTEAYVVLRNGYDHPFYYNEAIDYEVHSEEGQWLVMITPDFHEFWPLEQVRGSYAFIRNVWTATAKARERRRLIDTRG